MPLAIDLVFGTPLDVLSSELAIVLQPGVRSCLLLLLQPGVTPAPPAGVRSCLLPLARGPGGPGVTSGSHRGPGVRGPAVRSCLLPPAQRVRTRSWGQVLPLAPDRI